jgi:hypothetical protein
MTQAFAILMWITLVLCIIMLVGHGLWLLLAFAVRHLFGGHEYRSVWQVPVDVHELDAVCRHLHRMLLRRKIDVAEYARLRDGVDPEYARLGLQPPPRGEAPITRLQEVPLAPPKTEPPRAAQAASDAVPASAAPAVETPLASSGASMEGPAKHSPAPTAGPASPFEFAETTPRPPRRPWTSVLQSFLEEKNIRWGELASGLLIIGSAIGLIVSLRYELERRIPYFPALLFMLVTAAIHASGAYSLKKWKLKSTSRGVLTIGLLLVPLNLLAACLMSGQHGAPQVSATHPVFLLAASIAVVAYSAMTIVSCKLLFGEKAWYAAMAILACSLWQIVVHRVSGSGAGDWQATWLLALPVTGFLAAMLLFLRRVGKLQSVDDAETTLLIVGISLFAVLTLMSLYVSQVGLRIGMTGIAVFWMPLLAMPLLIAAHRLGLPTPWQLTRPQPSGISADSAAEQQSALPGAWAPLTAGSLVIVGTLLPVVALAISWSATTKFLVASISGGAAMAVVAVLTNVPAFSAAAALLLSLALVIGVQTMAADVAWEQLGTQRLSAATFLTATTCCALVVAAVLTIGGGLLARHFFRGSQQRARHGVAVALAGGLAGVLSFALVFVITILSPAGVPLSSLSLILLLHAATALTAGAVEDRADVRRGGLALLLLALLHACGATSGWRESLAGWADGVSIVLPALLLHAITCSLGAAIFGGMTRIGISIAGEGKLWHTIAREMLLASAITATTAMLVALPDHASAPRWMVCDLLLAALCVLHAALRLWSPWLFAVFQAGGTAAALFAVAAVAMSGLWVSDWLDPRHLALQLTAASTVSLLWCLLRWFRPPLPDQSRAERRQTVDALLLGSLFIVLPLVAAAGCAVGINRQLALFSLTAPAHQWLESADIPARLWPALSVLAVATAIGWRTSLRPLVVPGFVLLQFTLLLMIAGACGPLAATASALRWLMALWVLVVSGGWLIGHRFRSISFQAPSTQANSTPVVRDDLMSRWITYAHALAALVTVALVVLPLIRSLWGTIPGPDPAWPLASLAWQADYGIPALLQLAALMAAAVCLRDDGLFRTGAALLSSLAGAVTILTALAPVHHSAWFASVFPWSGLVIAAYVLSWQAAGNWVRAGRPSAEFRGMLSGLALLFAAAVPAMALWGAYQPIGSILPEQWLRWASMWSWLTLSVTAVALVPLAKRRQPIALPVCVVLALALIGQVAASVAAHHPLAHLAALRVIAAGTVSGAFLWQSAYGVFHWRATAERPFQPWMAATLAVWHTISLVALLAALIPGLDRTWFAAANGLLVASAALAALAFSPVFGYVGGAHILAIFGELWLGVSPTGWRSFPAAPNWGMTALAVYAMLMLALDIGRQRTGRPARWQNRWVRMPVLAADGMSLLLAIATGVEIARQLARPSEFASYFGDGIWLNQASGWLAMISVGVLLLMLFWDRGSGRQIPRFYLWSASIAGLLCAALAAGERLYVLLGLALALLVSWVALLYRQQASLTRVASLCGINHAETMMGSVRTWIVPLHALLVLLCVGWQFDSIWNSELRSLRMAAAFTPLILGLGTAAIASVVRKRWIMISAFALLAVFALYVSWSDLSPTIEHLALRRWARVALGMAVATIVLGALGPRMLRIEGEWARCLQRTAFGTAIATLVGLAGLLVSEAIEYLPGRGTPLPTAEAATIAVVLLATIVGLVVAALTPTIGGVHISLARRKACVYLAEAVGACLALHVALAMPFLLRPEWRGFWPYLVMGLAFAAAAAGHLAQRQRLPAVSEPLLRTGVLLPLAPFVLTWFVPADSDYALLLFLGGLLYLAHAVVYRQARYAAAAIVAANLALWSLLQRYDALQFLQHPQLWLIPPALCVLVTVQWYRDKLSKDQVSAVRYGALAVMYISSTSEIFLVGVGQQLWPPMILVGLSVLGMMMGIALKIRAFLVVGCTFLFVSLVTMVMHAHRALGHVWPWWAFGIGLGLAILTLFGLFEKKRAEMSAWLNRLRQWDV